MKKYIKKVLKFFVSEKYFKKLDRYLKIKELNSNNISKINKLKYLVISNFKIKTINIFKFSKIFKYTEEKIIYSKYFAYFIDFKIFVNFRDNLCVNMTPDYNVILDNSLNDLKIFYKNNSDAIKVINEIEKYLDVYISIIKKSNYENKEQIILNLEKMKDKRCSGFIEALQRILFFNQIFWQMGYTLCGLGRLDFILDEYYNNDTSVDKKEIEKIILDFYEILNYHYEHKSSSLNGDTGQIIILGGLDTKGKNFENDLTFKFIEVLQKFNKPDPKLLLRVNKNINHELLKKSIECMATGIGSPLLSNDDVIISRLQKFGYNKLDSYNYVTAACWEPSPCGNSVDYNNVHILNLLKPLNALFDDTITNINDIENQYLKLLKEFIKEELQPLTIYKYDKQPYLSLFIKDCRNSGRFIDKDTVKYKNLGITTLGISNVVNSILNIKYVINDKKIMSFDELNELRKNNFTNQDILKLLKINNKFGYGSNNKDAIELTDKITKCISTEFKKYKTFYGGDFKFGLSAPSYVDFGKDILASFDGRKNNEPLNVHISSTENSFIDVMDFASKIEYRDNGINGNVIDFIVSPSYINNNIEKFTDYIKAYIEKGIYQMQINVIDSKTLIAAKENPNLYKNLIVRVWGFSAYFNELPEEYKDLLIKRAQEAERVNM